MSDPPSQQTLDIEYDHLGEKMATMKDKPDEPYRFEVTQFFLVQISLRLTNESFIHYTFCLSTGF